MHRLHDLGTIALIGLALVLISLALTLVSFLATR